MGRRGGWAAGDGDLSDKPKNGGENTIFDPNEATQRYGDHFSVEPTVKVDPAAQAAAPRGQQGAHTRSTSLVPKSPYGRTSSTTNIKA